MVFFYVESTHQEMLSRSILYVGGKRFIIIHLTDLKKIRVALFFLKLVACFE